MIACSHHHQPRHQNGRGSLRLIAALGSPMLGFHQQSSGMSALPANTAAVADPARFGGGHSNRRPRRLANGYRPIFFVRAMFSVPTQEVAEGRGALKTIPLRQNGSSVVIGPRRFDETQVLRASRLGTPISSAYPSNYQGRLRFRLIPWALPSGPRSVIIQRQWFS